MELSRRVPPLPWQELLRRTLPVLARRPSALICDIDGVLSDIAPTPEAAFVAPAAKAALRRLVTQLNLVAVVSGRSAPNAASMVGVETIVVVGNHGMETITERGERREHPKAVGVETALTESLREIQERLRGSIFQPSVLVEHKGLTATVHYRLAEDTEAARAEILPIAVEAAQRRGLVVTEGRLIVELRPNIVVNKGTAIIDLVVQHRLRGVIFLGDDVTDVDGFVALRALRDREEIDAIVVGVLGAETPAVVVEAMDVGVQGVAAVGLFLTALGDSLAATAGETDDSQKERVP